MVKLIHLENEAQIFTIQNSPDYDIEVPKKHTDQELMKVATDLMSLHKSLNHGQNHCGKPPLHGLPRGINPTFKESGYP